MAEAARFVHITKRFPGVVALDDVTLDIAAGSCHALCGENGAGKSTLAKILAGIYRADAGELHVHGQPVQFASPRDALQAGVGIVHQELAFCENLSIAENLCLSGLPARRGLLQRGELLQGAQAMLREIGMELDVRRLVGDLTIAQQQMVQIAAAVSGGARIIIFDEPTSSLTHYEAERSHELVQRLKARGVTCIYVSHRLGEIFKLCDTISVLRDGRHVATRAVSEWTHDELVQAMIGRSLSEYFPQHLHGEPKEELLRVADLTAPGKFSAVSFSVRAGEIVGLAGLVGAGRSEIAQAIFGLDPTATGSVWVRGQQVRPKNARHAVRLGLGLVPEDRKRQGLVLSESGTRNTSLPILERLARATWVRTRAERALVERLFAQLQIRTASMDARVDGLSGGNQQKVVLAKWLAAGSRVLFLDEPTRGVDVGAKAEIHHRIDELAAAGHGVVLISSELPEIISLATRIIVLREGKIVGELARSAATQAAVLRLMSAS